MMVTGDVMCKERRCPQITGNYITARVLNHEKKVGKFLHLTAEVRHFCYTKIAPPQTPVIGRADVIMTSSTKQLKQTVRFVPEMTHFTFKRVFFENKLTHFLSVPHT